MEKRKRNQITRGYKDFFRFCNFLVRDVSRFVASYFVSIESWIIAIDRTQWCFGKKVINILTVCIVNEGISFPIWWKVLPKKGNTNTNERIDAIERIIKLFGKEKIRYILCDREFIGEEWIRYLLRVVLITVIPAQAGIQKTASILDSRFRGNDKIKVFRTTLNISFLFFNIEFILKSVIPAQAGINKSHQYWIPTFVGMTFLTF